MSILIVKKFDLIMREMSEMMGDIQTLKPSKISFNVMGDVCEFEDVTIELHNGFLKVIGDDGVDVLRYRDVCGYSLKSLHTPSKSPLFMEDDDGEMINVDDVDVDGIWRELKDTPSTLSPSLLSRKPSQKEIERICEEFICEYNGYSFFDEMDDDWLKDDYMEWSERHKGDTYGELNNHFSEYLWELYYPSHVMEDDLKTDVKNGVKWSKNDYLWINDVISHYWDVNEGEDEDE